MSELNTRLSHIGNNLIRSKQEREDEAKNPLVIDRAEINEILISKGYLADGQDIKQLKPKSELLMEKR